MMISPGVFLISLYILILIFWAVGGGGGGGELKAQKVA